MTLIAFELNGRHVQVAECATHTTLLDYVRSQGLTGSKEGCAEGECGACTVLLVKPNGTGSKLVPVNSCLVLLPMAAGQEVYTVEALELAGKLADVQQAMIEMGGSQCGYCTPGFIVSMFAEQYRPDRVGPCDPHSLSGNLCRCTGYRPIRDALAKVGPPSDERFCVRVANPAPVLDKIEASGFSRPRTLAECLNMLQREPHGRLVAGATDLAVESNLHGRRFEHLISLEALPELRMFADTADEVVIGAGLALSEVGLLWKDAPVIVREWLALFASPLIRNRATLGGNLATASPIGDSAPMLMALDARVKIASPDNERIVALADFFTGYRTTLLKDNELLVSIHIPKPLPKVARFYKVAKRRMDDISTVAAGIAIHGDGSVRVAFGGVAATPVLASVDRSRKLGTALHPISDHRGSAEYRLAMAQSLLDKFWYEEAGA